MSEDEAMNSEPSMWRGKNYLGEVLDELRLDFINGI